MKSKYVPCVVARLKISDKHSWYIAKTHHCTTEGHLLATSTTEPNLVVRAKTKNGAIRELTRQLNLLGYETDFDGLMDYRTEYIEAYDLPEPYCLIGRDA